MRFATTRLGKDVVDLLDVRVTAGDRVLLDRVTWRLAPGERTGVIGVNGSGKSTLLRAIAGEVPLAAGKRKVGVTVRLAMLSQEVRELEAWGDRRVIEAVEGVRSVVRLGRKELTASQLAQRLGFTGSRQQTRVGDLSGGERRRLQLTRLLMDEPNVLLLDEPTNDLDIETLTSLEDLLDGWAGTLVVVSHDRYLLERVCDRQVALLGDGRLRDLPGGVEEYLRLRATAGAPGRGPVCRCRAVVGCRRVRLRWPVARLGRRPRSRAVAGRGPGRAQDDGARREAARSARRARGAPARGHARGGDGPRSGCWASTASCARSSTSERRSSSSGWRPPSSPADPASAFAGGREPTARRRRG